MLSVIVKSKLPIDANYPNMRKNSGFSGGFLVYFLG
jgi:hypothetical protein